MENTNIVLKTIEESKVESSTALALQSAFMPFFEQANEWAEKAKSLVVTDATEVSKMKEAREARLIMRKIRTDADKTRETLKADSLRYGKAVQGVYNVIEFLIKPIEDHLEKQEKFAEIKEQERQESLRVERQSMLDSFQAFLPPLGDLGKMKSEDFDRVLSIAKSQKEVQEKEQERLQQEAIAKAKAEAEARESMRLENERIKADNERLEAEKKEAEAKAMAEKIEAQKDLEAERQAMQEMIDAERKERERIEAEAKSKADKERKEAEAKAMAEKKAKSAPDNEKLIALAVAIDSFAFPDVSTEEAQKTIANVKGLLAKVSAYIKDNAK